MIYSLMFSDSEFKQIIQYLFSNGYYMFETLNCTYLYDETMVFEHIYQNDGAGTLYILHDDYVIEAIIPELNEYTGQMTTRDKWNGPYMLFMYNPSTHAGDLYDYNSYYYDKEPFILHPTSKIYKRHARHFVSYLKKMGVLIKIGTLSFLCGWNYMDGILNGRIEPINNPVWKDELRLTMEEVMANRKLKTE